MLTAMWVTVVMAAFIGGFRCLYASRLAVVAAGAHASRTSRCALNCAFGALVGAGLTAAGWLVVFFLVSAVTGQVGI